MLEETTSNPDMCILRTFRMAYGCGRHLCVLTLTLVYVLDEASRRVCGDPNYGMSLRVRTLQFSYGKPALQIKLPSFFVATSTKMARLIRRSDLDCAASFLKTNQTLYTASI